jgi:hypothetical protein
MFLHRKELIHPVDVDTPDPKLAPICWSNGPVILDSVVSRRKRLDEHPASAKPHARTRHKVAAKQASGTNGPQYRAANIERAVARTTSGARAAGQSR